MPNFPKKKCPPGVICVENMTLFIIFLVVCIAAYLFYNMSLRVPSKRKGNSDSGSFHQQINIEESNQRENTPWYNFFTRPNYGYTNVPGDVLMNPYAAPLKDDRYFVPEVSRIPPGSMPINVSTNVGAVDTSYRQLGLLTPLSGGEGKILPLMGRPLFVNRNKYQYYTMSDQNNSVKLPVVRNGKSCTNEYGCDEIYNGDSVYVQGYNKAYKVTMYDNDTIKYLPYL
jgi:hypothetical protein